MPGAPAYPQPRLRGELIRRRPLGIEEEARPYAPEAGWFPAPRVNRIGGASATGAPSAAPRAISVPFNIQSGANSRTSTAVAQLVGPAILRGLFIIVDAGGPITSLDLSLDIGYATSALSEAAVALSTPRPYTSIFTPQWFPSAQIQANIFGIPSFTLINSQSFNTLRWDIPITQNNFFLIMATCNNEAAAHNFAGVVYLLDGVDAGALANFL
jgi:hypothetical protein